MANGFNPYYNGQKNMFNINFFSLKQMNKLCQEIIYHKKTEFSKELQQRPPKAKMLI